MDNNDPSSGVTSSTEIEMHALTDDPTTSTGWSLNDWDFGSTSQYPALRSYKTDDSDMQIEGDIICAQPDPRVQCSPTLTFVANTPLPVGITENPPGTFNFGDVSIVADPPTLTYILVGENLTADVVLMSSENEFTISVNTLVSIDGKINQEVTVTFDPAAVQTYTGTITHSDGGLMDDLVLSLEGEGITAPTLIVETTLPDGITESPENTFNFDKVNIASSVNFTYMLTGINLTGDVTLAAPTDGFTISPTGPLAPATDGSLSQEITVTFDPAAVQTYTGTITHSGGGLMDDLVLNLNGRGINPTLTFTAQDPLPASITQDPSGTFNFGNVNTASTTTVTYDLTGANLIGEVTLAIEGAPTGIFTINTTDLLTPADDGSLSQQNHRHFLTQLLRGTTQARSPTAATGLLQS